MTLAQFVSRYEGKGIDFDGSFGNQCVDLYRQYCKDVLNIPQTPLVVGAKDIWTGITPDFDKVSNTPTGVPSKGDIVIWGSSFGPYGHVAVFVTGDSNKLTCFSQNDPSGALCGLKEYKSYKGVLGWLRPRSTIVEENMDIRLKLLDDNNFKTEGDVRGLIGAAVDLPKARVDLENANKTIDQLNHAIDQYKTDLKAETDSFTAHSVACREEKAILLKNVADALGTTQDLPRILQAIQQLVTANENLDKLERKAKEDITTISDLNATILRKEEANKSLQINRDGLKSTIERIYATFSKITQISVKDEADLNVAIQTLSGGIKIQEPIVLSIINWFKRLWKI